MLFFENGWLSAIVGFTMVKPSISKTKDPKINDTSQKKTTNNNAQKGLQTNLKIYPKGITKGTRNPENTRNKQ